MNPTTKPPMEPPPPLPPEMAQPNDSAGPAPLRRLTVKEYTNTVRDLLGIETAGIGTDSGLSGDIPAWEHGFLKGATVGSPNDARLYLQLSDKIAASAMPKLASLVPQGCANPAAGEQEKCAKQFIEEFGLRAYRRPLASDEKDDLFALYSKVRGADIGATYPEAIEALISAFLQSPMFTYRWETLGQTPQGNNIVRLGHYEMASRLSYMTLASMPDAELFDAAARGELNDPDKIAQHTRRLLASDKAKEGLSEFAVQWLNVTSLPTLSKDESFTDYTPAVGATMLKETGMFFASVLQGQSGKLDELFTSPKSFIDEKLAKLYGVSGVTGANLRETGLNPAQRAGVLTHGSFLAAHSDGDEPHPVHRGLEVMEKVLCMTIVPPPDFVPPPVKDVAPNISNRKRFEESTMSEPSCAGCHKFINAVGFAFENYNAVGGWRDTDANMPVDASGTFEFKNGAVPFKNGVEFSKAVATSAEARSCMAKQFLEYALRRPTLPSEKGSIKVIEEAFTKSGYDLRELLVATTKTRAFTHRQPLAGEGQQ